MKTYGKPLVETFEGDFKKLETMSQGMKLGPIDCIKAGTCTGRFNTEKLGVYMLELDFTKLEERIAAHYAEGAYEQCSKR